MATSDKNDNKTTSDDKTTSDKKTNPSLKDLVPNTKSSDKETTSSSSNVRDDNSGLSPHVVATVPNKTPSELAAETPEETAARYSIDTNITDQDADNPNVQVYRDQYVQQVPSGTHLHPDIAKSSQNRGISQNTTDSAQVSRQVTETYDFAPDAPYNDKFVAPDKDDNEFVDARDQDHVHIDLSSKSDEKK